jgi:hypothetical protein
MVDKWNLEDIEATKEGDFIGASVNELNLIPRYGKIYNIPFETNIPYILDIGQITK